MKLCLIPRPPLPTVLFVLSFPKQHHNVPLPANWTAQLQHILECELDTPQEILALDKSVWAVSLLSEVTFSLAAEIVTCHFVDGSRLAIPIRNPDCIAALEAVLADVHEAALSNEFEQRERERERERARQVASPAPSRPISPVKPTKHKRTRSILMCLASLVLSSRPSSPVQAEPEVAPPPSPLPESVKRDNNRTSRYLKRRARGLLVDIYRRWVVPELLTPFPHGGYLFWIAQSKLHRIDCRMQELEAIAGQDVSGARVAPPRLQIPPSGLPEVPSEEDEEGSSVTDTDGSSVHTPQDSFSDHQVICRSSGDYDPLVDAEAGIPRTPSPASPPPPPVPAKPNAEAVAEYSTLHDQSVRLQNLLDRAEAAENSLAAERETQLRILEVKSRRRAWSSHALLGRATATDAGLGTPSRSSPLAFCAVMTPETLAEAAARLAESSSTALSRTTASSGSRMGRVRGVSNIRLDTIPEREDRVPEDVHCYEVEGFEFTAEPQMSPPVNYVPFPQYADFAATAPHDPLPLFAHPDVDESLQDQHYHTQISGEVYYTHPSVVSHHSYGAQYYDQVYDEQPPGVPFHIYTEEGYDLPSERGCGEFTLALESYDTDYHRLGLANGSNIKIDHEDWLPGPVTCRR